MPRQIVVFDTNVYRHLSRAAAIALRLAQRECSVIACANFWTIMELGAHLADPSDGSFRAAHAALQTLWDHCTQYDGSSMQLRIAPEPDSQLVLALFHRHIPGRAEETNRYAFLVKALADVPVGEIPAVVQPLVEHLRQHRDEVEAAFAEDMRSVVKGIDPAAAGWQPFANDPSRRREELRSARAGDTLPVVATAMVARASAAAGIRLSEEDDIVGRVRFVLDNSLRRCTSTITASTVGGAPGATHGCGGVAGSRH